MNQTYSPEQIVTDFLPYMGWTTSKADDAWVLELPAEERFSFYAAAPERSGKLRQSMLRSQNGTVLIYDITDAVIRGQSVRLAKLRIGDVINNGAI